MQHVKQCPAATQQPPPATLSATLAEEAQEEPGKQATLWAQLTTTRLPGQTEAAAAAGGREGERDAS